ncbi:IS3 family transposase, partial [Escherichia coli]|uniref:IS3 family transposase n=1 Tax=Escherichia coli TaxID=562 RepID=UPI0029C43C0B
AEIPRSTFYYHLKALSKPDKYADVKKRISEIYHENRGRYGYRRVTLSLHREGKQINHKAVQRLMGTLSLKAAIKVKRYGYRRVTLSLHREGKQINHKAVQRLMGTLSLKAAIKVKRYRSYRGEVGQTAPNVLQRDFKATRPNEKWVTDVTEFAVNGRKLYLSPVIDLFNNEVISYSLSERPVMNMVENMLDQAFKKLNPHEHPVLHSDQGWQYRMRRYQNILKEHGIKQSMSRKGNCLDNAVVECFFGTLKSECFYLDEFSNISELKDAVTEYIEYYNSRRISLKLKGLTPIEYRNQTYMPRV